MTLLTSEMNKELMDPCRLCPRRCGAARLHGETGYCGARAVVKAARAALHYWEEPCISGTRGAGAVFFSHCNLGCIYCQNSRISRGGEGEEITTEHLAEIFCKLQEQGAHCIDLVTAVHYLPPVCKAIEQARLAGLRIPTVYNSGGYESAEILRMAKGYFDMYMPDLKYVTDGLAAALSNAPDYPSVSLAAIDEMLAQTGPAQFDGDGIMRRGVLIRHLVLPGHTRESMAVLRLISERWGDDVYVSIMNQYTPVAGAGQREGFGELARQVTKREYGKVVDEAIRLGLTHVYIQEGGTAQESFIPDFDGEGIL